ncbi:hypothetical protein ACFSO0_19500 [Brevibacillus sp. GCM10020057]|uniref:hypothetical protein n=1 Tax=Brevibacillus sp. GCM10020057 TaxID=3317327 RepID=UPI00363B78D6
MPKLIIEEDFWSLFPHAKIGAVICQGIDKLHRPGFFVQPLVLHVLTKKTDPLCSGSVHKE